VPIDEARVHLEKLGIPANKISVTGIPIDPIFAGRKDKIEMRRKHGLKPDRTTILVSAGGFGAVSLDHVITSLMDLKHEAQVMAIAGRNEELKSQLLKLVNGFKKKSVVDVHVVGYTTEMDEYMSAADLILGKPGGLTTSEALAKGLILVIVNPIPGQEERNSDHLLEEGVAIRCNNLPALAYKIDKLLGDTKRFNEMRKNVRRLATPNSASDIVSQLLKLK
jgi:processive 1,2-diacylglycerol beta-glucosyltransferase